MNIDKSTYYRQLLFNESIEYNGLTLNPIRMKDIIDFQQYQNAFTVRKDAIFHEKNIIKMDYWEFIKYAYRNFELAEKYEMPLLPFYYDFILNTFLLSCGDDIEIKISNDTLDCSINDIEITGLVFDNMRKIILLQNDIDFDIEEFMNIDTIRALEKAREFEMKKNKEKADIEDYIDSLVIGLKVTEEYISNLTIRKFWRYIKRINKHEDYQSGRSAQMTGMVTFKEPLKHWMTSLEVEDKYENLKTDEDELRSKVGE